ncbi:unnamed protein product [Spirodela intermedia]|uniref:Poor homologous synapsis 1 PH domain-containing protein n=1 Tax=Spirodela intermedia TaxID=51605 RepID=A0A7I8JPV8_SPIIN|nr:unnamed protein product [Spirodela intermedia]CAA6671462.1 unnamed protein product [Spirodela intermedia]
MEEAGNVALVGLDQSGEAASSSAEWKESWEVEFSRFFNFPSVSSDALASHSLKPITKYRTRGGTWVTASSQARLQLEEHFISNLSISWPQVSCASECPTRTHKFAIRFNASSLLQDFLDNIEKICNDKKVAGTLLCEEPTTSDQIGSNRLQHRSSEESGFSKPSSPYTPDRCSLQPLFVDDIDAFSGVPPSFTELLTECSTQIAVSVDDFLTSLEQLMLAGEADLKCQIEKCLADASFRGRPGGVVVMINLCPSQSTLLRRTHGAERRWAVWLGENVRARAASPWESHALTRNPPSTLPTHRKPFLNSPGFSVGLKV